MESRPERRTFEKSSASSGIIAFDPQAHKLKMHSPNEQICKRSLISGQVQGVSFLYHACKKAIELGLIGSVKFLPDGRIEAFIQGDRAMVEAMGNWFWEGAPDAQVEAVETEEVELHPFEAFEIFYLRD